MRHATVGASPRPSRRERRRGRSGRGRGGTRLGHAHVHDAPADADGRDDFADRSAAPPDQIASMDTAALRADAERFRAVCGPVGILPPDQYLSLVVRATEGCSWNGCTFCRLYSSIPFRAKTPAELAEHVAALRDYFGRSLALRRSVFLGDANALCLAQERLRPLLETVAAGFPGLPLFSFVDAWTGRRKTTAGVAGLPDAGPAPRLCRPRDRRSRACSSWLGKPGTPGDAIQLVEALHEGGVAAGVIVLVGAGGERFFAAHVGRTIEVLAAMPLASSDIVYLSEYVDDPLAPDRHAAGPPDLAPLSPERARQQHEEIVKAVRRSSGPRLARYDLREFVY